MELSPMDRMILPNLFESKERQALYQLICGVRLIGKHHMVEKENYIYDVTQVVGISSQDKEKSRSLTREEMVMTMKNMEDIKKLYLAKFASKVALIGGISQQETIFLNMLYKEIEVPEEF
ncbi:hypothetical protein QVN91_01985 [Bacteroides caecigallinarum]|nr:hypothetical protein [Bacteroides caecigallinarum]